MKNDYVAPSDALKGTLTEVFDVANGNFGKYVLLAIVPFALSILLPTVQALAINSAGSMGAVASSFAWLFGGALVQFILYTYYAILIHRVILLDETKLFVSPSLYKNFGLFLLVLVAEAMLFPIFSVSGFFVGSSGLGDQAGGTYSIYKWFAIAGVIATVYCMIRLMTVFPHIATTPARQLTLVKALGLSSRRFWSIFLRVLPLALVLGLGLIILLSATSYLFSDLPAEISGILIGLVGSLFGFVFVAMMISLASVVYRRLQPEEMS